MTTCTRCGSAAHIDFASRDTRCNTCDRTAAWCRCERTAERKPLWLELARSRRGGLSRDETGAAA